MSNITIVFKDGTIREFLDKGRAGGSWSNTVKYENGFAVVTDEWEDRTAFPSSDIKEVRVEPSRGHW